MARRSAKTSPWPGPEVHRDERFGQRQKGLSCSRRSGAGPATGGLLSVLLFWSAALANLGAAHTYVPATLTLPEPAREFRAAWIATVKNIDWPSRPGLAVTQQQAELVHLLDTAARLRLNAVLLQVRTACDAVYHSNLEPWSEYLTGRMGQAPAPYYDPLGFAIEAAHRRGIELHAWFNPYRARHTSAFSPIARQHISKTRPDLVKTYGTQLWLDPGNAEVQELSLKVVLDVVQRYDIDGVHFDDYFYPYPEKDARNQLLPFPDWASWEKYRQGGGSLARDDWRRENVNVFLRRVAAAIKQRKPWVKFGVSPFGIWRPGHPSPIRGFDAYALLYADSRKWLTEGVCDYLAPQLYWPSERAEQSYPVLLQWWRQQNASHRHLWPGLAHVNGAAEVASQIRQSRRLTGDDGHLHWSMKAIVQNRGGIADVLRRELYATPALTPEYPWLKAPLIPKPRVEAMPQSDGSIRFSWARPDSVIAWQWVVQRRHNGQWTTDILGGTLGSFTLAASQCPEALAIRATDRFGHLGPATILQRAPAPVAGAPTAAGGE
jgi:uncharacterized lipoprotein YddW (UPF0748 family)